MHHVQVKAFANVHAHASVAEANFAMQVDSAEGKLCRAIPILNILLSPTQVYCTMLLLVVLA